MKFPRQCRCGEVWSREHWPELPLVGRYSAGRDGWIELRTCVCGATMVVEENDQKRSEKGDPEPTARPDAS